MKIVQAAKVMMGAGFLCLVVGSPIKISASQPGASNYTEMNKLTMGSESASKQTGGFRPTSATRPTLAKGRFSDGGR
jgi:hypothetical protein